MNTASQDTSGRGNFAIFARGFRPFFFGAAIWAVIAIGIWVDMLLTGVALPSRFHPLNWPIHEMLFGFVMADVAGFLLTAIELDKKAAHQRQGGANVTSAVAGNSTAHYSLSARCRVETAGD